MLCVIINGVGKLIEPRISESKTPCIWSEVVHIELLLPGCSVVEALQSKPFMIVQLFPPPNIIIKDMFFVFGVLLLTYD